MTNKDIIKSHIQSIETILKEAEHKITVQMTQLEVSIDAAKMQTARHCFNHLVSRNLGFIKQLNLELLK